MRNNAWHILIKLINLIFIKDFYMIIDLSLLQINQ
jgi:hypothetical protein